jgi:hypothetical protein
MGAGICVAIAFGALMDIFFGQFVLWVGLGLGASAAVHYLVQKRTDRGTDSSSGVVWNLSFKSFLIIFFGLAVLGAAGAIVSLVRDAPCSVLIAVTTRVALVAGQLLAA